MSRIPPAQVARRVAEDVAGAIIAGGQARRMGGRVKALIEVDGAPILTRQLEILRGRVSAIAIAANDPAPYGFTGLPVIADRVPGAGPLAGLEAALAHFCERAWVLALACDMPHIDGRLIDLLLARRGPDIDVVVPVRDGRPEPLCALYARRLLPIVSARIDRQRLAVHGLFDEPGVRVTRIAEAEMRALDPELGFLRNVNRPEDLPG